MLLLIAIIITISLFSRPRPYFGGYYYRPFGFGPRCYRPHHRPMGHRPMGHGPMGHGPRRF